MKVDETHEDVKEIKNDILSGKFQRDLKGKYIKSAKAVYEELD
jgi:hypothetical protein